MGMAYGPGFANVYFPKGAPRAHAIDALTKLADLVGDSVHDLVGGEALSVLYGGTTSVLEPALAARLADAVKRGNVAGYESFAHLDAYTVLWACEEETEIVLADGRRVQLQPFRFLRRHLTGLLMRDDLPETTHEFHRELRDLVDLCAELQVPLVLGDAPIAGRVGEEEREKQKQLAKWKAKAAKRKGKA